MSKEGIAYYVDRRGARRTVIFYLVLAIAFLLFDVYLFDRFGDGPVWALTQTLGLVTGIGGFIVFSTLGLIFVRRLHSKEPYLLINAQGIYDNASGMSAGAGWIAWSEIADIRLSTYHGLPCVELVPKSRHAFLQRFGGMERINRSSWLGYPAVAIRGPLLPVEPAVLVEQMRTYWRSAPNT